MKKILKGIVVGSVFLSIGIPKISALSIDGVDAPVDGTNLVVKKESDKKYTLTVNSSTSNDIIIAGNEEVTLVLANNAELSNKTKDTIYVTKGGKLNIEGKGTITNNTHGKAAIFNNGATTINSKDVTITRKMITNKNDASQTNNYYAILNHGNMTIQNAKVIEKQVSGNAELTNYSSSLIANGYYDYNNKSDERVGYVEAINTPNPELKILDGDFTGGMNTVKNDDGGILTISGGTFKNTYQVTVMNWNEATINGGTFDTTGNIKDKTALFNGMYDVNTAKGILNINGGTFIGDHILEGNNYLADKTLKVNIKDGNFKYNIAFVRPLEGNNQEKKATTELKNKANVTVTGGVFAKDDVNALYGLSLEKQADNTYTFKKEEQQKPDDTNKPGTSDNNNNPSNTDNNNQNNNGSSSTPSNNDDLNNNQNMNDIYNNQNYFRPPQTSDKIVMYGSFIAIALGVLGFITKKLM